MEEEGIDFKKQSKKHITLIIFDGKGQCGVLEEWKVEEGETIKSGTVLGLVRTDHTVFAIRNNAQGIIEKLLYKQGDEIADGAEVAKVVEMKTKTYDTGPIVENINQLLRKRKETEQAIARAKTEEEKGWRMIICDEIDEKVTEKRKEILNMYKELMTKEQDRFLSDYPPFEISRSEANEHCKYVPRLPLDPRAIIDPDQVVTIRTLIPQLEKYHYFPPYFCGKSTSTYPNNGDKGREGEPICDQYQVTFSPPVAIIAVADGCNWGTGPAEAAAKASKAFIETLSKNRDLFRSTNLVAHLCLDGIVAAHNAIIKGPHEEGKSIGTTTLLGGVLSKVILPNHENTPPELINDWVFVFASIGDCKAFLWVSQKDSVEELTPDSRGENFGDASDCGGRIGPYINGGPDTRNLEIFMAPCSKGDIIFVCSDGVHDNFDPQMQGVSPTDLGSSFDSWDTIDAISANALKAEYRCKRLYEVMKSADDPTDIADITNTIVSYCVDMAVPSQNFMRDFPDKRLPHDYTRFPGKMDHTTLVCVRVGEYESEHFEQFIQQQPEEYNELANEIGDAAVDEAATPLSPNRISFIERGESGEFSRLTLSRVSSAKPKLKKKQLFLCKQLCSEVASDCKKLCLVLDEKQKLPKALEPIVESLTESTVKLIHFCKNVGFDVDGDNVKQLICSLIVLVQEIASGTKTEHAGLLDKMKCAVVSLLRRLIISSQNIVYK